MFGSRLRELRKNKNMTMKELGKKFSLAESTISGYEIGNRRPDIEMINAFADFFEVTTDYLLGRSEESVQTVNKILNKNKLNTHDDSYDSLAEINKLVKQYGIEQMGFFDIEQWKNLRPEDVEEIRRHFEWVAQKAKERNEEEE